MKSKNNNPFEFNNASSYFMHVHTGPGNKEIIWLYQYPDIQKDIFLDFKGRKELVNYIREQYYINIFTIQVFLPYEVQIPVFYLRNSPYRKRIDFYNYALCNKNTTYKFISGINECKSYYSILDFFFQGENISYVKQFAINVLRILKLSTNPLATISDKQIYKNIIFLNISIEIAAMILTTERLRSEKSLLISYIEFYKLKHTNDPFNTLSDMFNKSGSSLIFPQNGGAKSIIYISPRIIYTRFIDMLKFSPVFNIFNNLPSFMQMLLKNEFYKGKLEKLKAMSENRSCLHHSKFKFFVMGTKKFFEFKYKLLLKMYFERFKDQLIKENSKRF